MKTAIGNLLRIASEIESIDPLLAYEFSTNIRKLVALANPGRKTHEQKIDETVNALRSMRTELDDALQEMEGKELQEFLVELPEEEVFENLVKKASIAAEPSYKMDEGDIDEFLKSGDWDTGKITQDEREESMNFLKDVDLVKRLFEQARKDKNPKGLVKKIITKVDELIEAGDKITGKTKKESEETKTKREEVKSKAPAPKSKGKESGPAPKVEPKPKSDVKAPSPEKKKEEGPEWSKKRKMLNLEPKVQHYTDMLKENIDDEDKLIKTLREFFHEMGPALQEERGAFASILPTLIKTASRHVKLQSALLPVIKKLANR